LIPKINIPAGGSLLVKVIVVGGLVLAAGSQSLFNVEGGHSAVVFNKFVGVKQHVYGEGTHLLIPWVERAEIYNVRAKPRSIPCLTGSKDLQMVNVTLRVLSKPDVSKLPKIFQTLGMVMMSVFYLPS